MKAKLAKLIDVKSIMTLVLTIVFCVLALKGTISGTEFLTIFTVIVGFYFGTQSQKKADETAYTGPQQAAEAVPEYDVQQTGNEVTPEMVAAEQIPPDEMALVGY